jgi:hypothetical protein
MSSSHPDSDGTMTPEEEQAALRSDTSDEGTEPADEGIGVHTDAAGDDRYTEN